MHHPTDRITHTTAFVTPVVEHWLEREIAQWVSWSLNYNGKYNIDQKVIDNQGKKAMDALFGKTRNYLFKCRNITIIV